MVETPIVHAGEPAGRVMVIHDMTAERRLVEELAWAASHDALTGLANRRQFEFELHRAMSVSPATGADLMLIDLDQFKIVNDTCGHMAGDRLLKQVAKLLDRRSRRQRAGRASRRRRVRDPAARRRLGCPRCRRRCRGADQGGGRAVELRP